MCNIFCFWTWRSQFEKIPESSGNIHIIILYVSISKCIDFRVYRLYRWSYVCKVGGAKQRFLVERWEGAKGTCISRSFSIRIHEYLCLCCCIHEFYADSRDWDILNLRAATSSRSQLQETREGKNQIVEEKTRLVLLLPPPLSLFVDHNDQRGERC